jgi:hypothetical protein
MNWQPETTPIPKPSFRLRLDLAIASVSTQPAHPQSLNHNAGLKDWATPEAAPFQQSQFLRRATEKGRQMAEINGLDQWLINDNG